MLSRWMCSNKRTRSPYSASSLRRPRRETAVRCADVAMTDDDETDQAERDDHADVDLTCARGHGRWPAGSRIGTTTRPAAPTIASAERGAEAAPQRGRGLDALADRLHR